MHRYDDVSKDHRQSWTTQKAYRAQIVNYLRWRTRNRERLEGLPTERKVELFLLKRTTHDRVGPVARKQSFCALLFLYRHVLKQPIGEIRKLGARPQVKHAPVVLDPQQVLSVIGEIEDSPHVPYRLIALMLYGCGLRISEALRLRIKDVSLTQSRLVLRDTKGGCDLHRMIPCCLMPPLQRQIERARLLWQQDRESGLPISLPGMYGLKRKYPQISHAWGWYYLFPQLTPSTDPQAWPEDRDTLYRHHQYDGGVQRAVRIAASKCDLDGVVTPHAFRHAFATHLHRRGETLPAIQQQLGHKNIETTMLYVHEHVTKMRSPLDDAIELPLVLPAAPRPALALPFAVA